MVGRTLDQSQITQKTGLAVMAVRHGTHGKYIHNPGAGYILKPNDVLFVVGDVTQIEQLRTLLSA